MVCLLKGYILSTPQKLYQDFWGALRKLFTAYLTLHE